MFPTMQYPQWFIKNFIALLCHLIMRDWVMPLTKQQLKRAVI